MYQKVVVVLKPHLEKDFPAQVDKIRREALARYEEKGLFLVLEKRYTFTKKQAEEFYAEHKGKSFFPLLIEATTMGPSIVMTIEGEDAIDIIREIHGPTNPPDCRSDQLRKKYGRDERGRPYNGFHCTASPEEYSRECLIAIGVEF